MDNPIVTILVLAYNQEAYIANALDGILSQGTSYSYKVIITDDASTDNTQSVIKDYINKNPNGFIPVFNESNIGLNETIRKVIPYIKTKYICLLGGDDYWIDKNKLQKEIDYLELHPEVSLVHTGYRQWIEEEKNGERTHPQFGNGKCRKTEKRESYPSLIMSPLCILVPQHHVLDQNHF